MVDKYVLGTNKEQRDNTSPKYRNIRFYGKTKVMSSLNYIPHIRKATTQEGGGGLTYGIIQFGLKTDLAIDKMIRTFSALFLFKKF